MRHFKEISVQKTVAREKATCNSDLTFKNKMVELLMNNLAQFNFTCNEMTRNPPQVHIHSYVMFMKSYCKTYENNINHLVKFGMKTQFHKPDCG